MRIALILALASTLFGCAFSNVNMVMPTDTPSAKGIDGGGQRVLLNVPFVDQRGMTRCGMQKNGYGSDTADATCSEDPALWVARLLRAKLKASNFEVLENSGATTSDTLRIHGTLVKLFSEPLLGTWSGSLETDIHVRLIATTDSGLHAERDFFVKGRQGGVMASVTPAFEASLRYATDDIVREMVEAIYELSHLDRTGARGAASRTLAMSQWRMG